MRGLIVVIIKSNGGPLKKLQTQLQIGSQNDFLVVGHVQNQFRPVVDFLHGPYLTLYFRQKYCDQVHTV